MLRAVGPDERFSLVVVFSLDRVAGAGGERVTPLLHVFERQQKHHLVQKTRTSENKFSLRVFFLFINIYIWSTLGINRYSSLHQCGVL